MSSAYAPKNVRYDPAPLFTAAAFSVGLKPPSFKNQSHPDEITHKTLAEILNTTSRSIIRWNKEGMTAKAVDKSCKALGRHPAEIYGYRTWTTGADLRRQSES